MDKKNGENGILGINPFLFYGTGQIWDLGSGGENEFGGNLEFQVSSVAPCASLRMKSWFFSGYYPEFPEFPPFPRAVGLGFAPIPKPEVELGLTPGNGKGLVAPALENPVEIIGI